MLGPYGVEGGILEGLEHFVSFRSVISACKKK